MSAAADRFRAMADRIDRNPDEDFAGALLIVPPKGEAVEKLNIDPSKNLADFWNSVKARVDIAHADFMELVRAQMSVGQTFGRR